MMLTEYNEEETMELFKKEIQEEERAAFAAEKAAYVAERAAYLSEMAALKAELEKYRASGIQV